MNRKRSAEVPAGLIILVASQLMLGGCARNYVEVRRCVDSYGRLLPDDYCSYPYTYTSGYGGYYYSGRPFFVYGGSGGYSYGSRITGYSTTMPDGATIVNTRGATLGRVSGGQLGSPFSGSGGSFGRGSATVTRGGFGGSSSGMSGSGGSFGGG